MKATDFAPILNIPEGVEGAYRIHHVTYPPGHILYTSTRRTEIIGGQRSEAVVFRHEVRFHELSYQHGVWMTDLPVEQAQVNRVLHDYAGDVLVGGLGLGYAAVRIAQRPQVRGVTVVEIAPEVIKLVANHLPRSARRKITIVQADLFKFLKNPTWLGAPIKRFDRAFYDIWQSDGEGTFFNTVVPLLQASPAVIRHRPDCWNEDVMRGQLRFGLQSRLAALTMAASLPSSPKLTLNDLCTQQKTIWWDWMVPFFRWYRAARPNAELLYEYIEYYANTYGLLGFTETWDGMIQNAENSRPKKKSKKGTPPQRGR